MRKAALRKAGFIDNPARPFTWDNWDDEYNDLTMGKTPMQFVLEWMIWQKERPSNSALWLWGKPGMGKTHLASVAAILWSIAYDVSAVYCSWSSRLAEIKDSFSGRSEADGLGREIGAGILVMDDMGAERVTLYNLECLYRVVEGRHGRPTIYTSNWDVKVYRKALFVSSRRDDSKMMVHALASKLEDRLQVGSAGHIGSHMALRSKRGSYRGTQ